MVNHIDQSHVITRSRNCGIVYIQGVSSRIIERDTRRLLMFNNVKRIVLFGFKAPFTYSNACLIISGCIAAPGFRKVKPASCKGCILAIAKAANFGYL